MDIKNTPDGTAQLRRLFLRNGYVRYQSAERIAEDGPRRYKKGDEIRFVVSSKKELAAAERWLRQIAVRPGKPFSKGLQFALPVYGRDEVKQLLELFYEKSR